MSESVSKALRERSEYDLPDHIDGPETPEEVVEVEETEADVEAEVEDEEDDA